MFYLDVPIMCIYALVSIINNTIQYNIPHQPTIYYSCPLGYVFSVFSVHNKLFIRIKCFLSVFSPRIKCFIRNNIVFNVM